MTIDELLADLRRYPVVIVNECELWPAQIVPPSLEWQFKKHRAGLARRINRADISVCTTRWHQPYYDYRDGCFFCAKCQELIPWVS